MKVRHLFSVLALALASQAFAATSEPVAPSPAAIQEWVRAAAADLPQGLPAPPEHAYFAFVVTPEFEVVAQAVLFRTQPRPALEEMQHLFPSISFQGSPMSGLAWLESTPSKPAYGVMWIVVPHREHI